MSFDLKYGGKGLWYGHFSNLPDNLVMQAVTARLGGSSSGCFASLNPAMHTDDDPLMVIENRQRIAEMLGLDLKQFVTAQQVHGDRIYVVQESDRGRGACDYATAVPETDGLITDRQGIALMMFFADCVPVMLVDPVRRAIGICHAGWRGTVAQIPLRTVQRMTEAFGSRPADILAAIAPSIGPCCYEIDEAVERQVRMAFGEKADRLLKKQSNQKWLLDLWQANEISLLEAGVPEMNIQASGICTNCNSKLFYSYRADHGKTGRLAVILALK